MPITFDLIKPYAPGDLDGLAEALTGFRESRSRHDKARDARDLSRAYRSVFEATMWITAIDDRLYEFHGDSYASSRGQSREGLVVRAINWARNRHAHQLPLTLDNDNTPFFGGGRGVISLSAGIRWRDASELPAPPAKYEDPPGVAAYREHLQGATPARP